VNPTSPAVFESGSGYLSTLIETPKGHMSLLTALCMSASSGKPYLPQLAPLVALCREQRSTPAQAGGVTSSPAALRIVAA
jgi:hypothetical protein